VAAAAEASDVWFAYAGDHWILRGISLSVAEGGICMVLGPSGSGKTTLLKLFAGLLQPTRGTVSAAGGAAGRRVAYIPQQLGLVRSLTALDNTLMGALGRTPTLPSLVRRFAPDDVAEAHELLGVLGIARKADAPVRSLSGGERQRVAIARALMQRPSLVLADEFVSHLDPVTTRDIMQAVAGIAEGGVAFLIVSHEAELVPQFGHRAAFLNAGVLVHECPAAQVDLAAAMRLMAR
jgi:phosphonate transport system ATP-binding protein